MRPMSLRTKGLILIVLISLIPLLLAGVSNYNAVKDAMMQSEMDTIASRLNNRANEIASWMAVRKAEVYVMSRTDIVRNGSREEKLKYFFRELYRNGYTYHAIGYIDKEGNAVRSDGHSLSMKYVSFYREAMKGNAVISDPYTPYFSDIKQTFIAVPVYSGGSEADGVLYASIPFTGFADYFEFAEDNSPVRLYNDEGTIIYSSDRHVPPMTSLDDPDSELRHAAEEMLQNENGRTEVSDEYEDYVVFYAKVTGTDWRIALQTPASVLEEPVKPIFWRICATIAVAELIIALLFFLYFERIVKRLEGILSVTEQAASGRFEAEHLDTSQGDEIGQLAHSVNGMMEHLQEMFDRLGAIVNQNQYGFIVLNEHYRVTFMNRAAEEMLGYKEEELAGHATPLIFMDAEEIRLEAEKLSQKLGREVQPGLEVFQVLRGRGQFSYEREWTFIRKDGTRFPARHSSTGLRDRNGRFVGVVGMIRDISDRKDMEKAKNRLLKIVESAKDLIASIDMDGKLIYMNRAGKEMLGLTEENEAGFVLADYMDRQMYGQLMKGAELAQEFGFWESGAELVKPNGETLHVSVIIVANKDESTGEMFYSCIARDISEQKLVQEELVRATLEAEEANLAKSRFLAMMSHEIRTPLNGIIGLTQLMRKTELSYSQIDYMDKMAMSSESLLRIINDVLDFSKIEAGKVEMDYAPFDPEELLNRLANQLGVFMGGKEQFEFLIRTPETLPAKLVGDAMRLEQVLLNLCMNAIKFTMNGLVKLEVQVAETNKDKAALLFEISDTGIGMSKEQLERLFKPFTQADNSTTRRFGGTGLGLVISKNLVEMMGGKLRVQSEEGMGSCFSFTLPFGFDMARHGAGKQTMLAQEYTVWVAEDSDRMREHWSAALEGLGITAITYSSWHALRDRLYLIGEGARPNLLLMDMEMPDMYGFDTWLDLRQEAESAGIPMIALTTSYGRDELLQLPPEHRPAAILLKPVTRDMLVRTLRAVMEQSGPAQAGGVSAVRAEETPPSPPGETVRRRVLLAEDNKINQLVAIELLKECGCEVGLAENGREALLKLEEQSWDMILMDIHMPVMDGTEAVRTIRSRSEYDDIPIVALTANVVKKDHEHYKKLGMNDVITKPLSIERLRETLARWLSHDPLPDSSSAPVACTLEKARLRGSASDAAGTVVAPIAGMDMQSALDRVNGKLPILLHMMEQFKLDYHLFMDKLRMALQQGERDTAIRLLHTLKGAAGYLSAHAVVEAASAAGSAVKQSDNLQGEELRLALARLESELGTLLQGLKRS